MKFREQKKFYDMLRKELGEDLVYSLAYDDGNFVMAISVHKSKTQKYDHGRNIQSCMFTEEDFDKELKVLIPQIVEIYKKVLIPV